ncbi:MAG TPA: hypothetical protein VN043_04975 [Rhodanobacter sp.]|nr:hypothetical protein [Rhodanobacter sp.]
MIALKKSGWLLLLLTLLAACLSACRRPTDEAQVCVAIETIVQAVEAGKISAMVTFSSADFDGNGGEMDRRALGNLFDCLHCAESASAPLRGR